MLRSALVSEREREIGREGGGGGEGGSAGEWERGRRTAGVRPGEQEHRGARGGDAVQQETLMERVRGSFGRLLGPLSEVRVDVYRGQGAGFRVQDLSQGLRKR
jgi:hypothetical protein